MGARYTSVGVWGQIGVPLVPKTLDIATRFNWLDASIDVGDDDFYSIEGQLAYYVSHTQGLVVKLRYAAGHQSSPGTAALGDVPLITVPGWTQLGIAPSSTPRAVSRPRPSTLGRRTLSTSRTSAGPA